jgi:predicted  nucleic acid-binding Zn-ribbon protein
MQQTCLKCGHVHTAAGQAPAVACPECGAIYAKVAQAMAARAVQVPAQGLADPATQPEKPPAKKISGSALGLAVLVVVAIGAYAVYDRQQFRAAAQSSEQQRIEQAAASRAAQAHARAEQRRVAAEQRRAEQAAMSPLDRRQEALKLQFSPWDGSHRAAEQAIKARMNNPASYQHVATTYVDLGPGRGITVNTRFRGTNKFNAVVTERATVEVDDAGRVTSVNVGG